jgi:hypothetical protein
MFPIRIQVGDLKLSGELNDMECAQALARVLPLTAEFEVWGDELHFEVVFEHDPGRRSDKSVSVGDIGFCSEGSMLCIFFGPTPASPREDPVSAVPVTIIGRVTNSEKLRTCKEVGEITVQPLNTQES